MVAPRRQVLALVRHGEPSKPDPSLFVGQVDLPLSRAGREKAIVTRERLRQDMGRDHQRAAIASSDLVRASEFADLLGGARRAVRDHRLREESLGPWEGLTADEVSTRFPSAYKDWLTGRSDDFGGREGLDRVANRATRAVHEHLDRSDHGCLIVVTHVNTVLALVGTLMGLDRRLWSSYPSPAYGHTIVLVRRPGHASWGLDEVRATSSPR